MKIEKEEIQSRN